LYQWQLAGTDAATIEQQLSMAKGFDKTDRGYFSALLAGVQYAMRSGSSNCCNRVSIVNTLN